MSTRSVPPGRDAAECRRLLTEEADAAVSALVCSAITYCWSQLSAEVTTCRPRKLLQRT